MKPRTEGILPTPFEAALLIGVSYFFWFFADGFEGIVFAVAGVGAGIVLSRLVRARGEGRIPPEAAWVAVAIVIALGAPFVASGDFRVTQLAILCYTALIVVGLNLLSGYLGQVSFAHAAFVGIGAYTVAVTVKEMDMPIVLAIVLATIVAAAAGVLLGVPAVRLSGPYLAIATAGLGIIFPPVLALDEISKYTGGFQGISLFSKKYGPPLHVDWLTDERWYYFLTLSALIVGVVLAVSLVNSAAGRALKAVHDSELAATAMGINVPYVKVTTFAISAAYAGFGGALLFLVSNRFVAPDGFGVLIAVDFLVATVMGGVASIPGSILGGFFFVYFYREGLETMTSQTEAGNDWWLIISGVVLAAVVLFGNPQLRTRARRLADRIGEPFGNPVLNAGRAAVAVGVGVLLAIFFRLGGEHLFNVQNLRNGLTGLSLILIILFMPNGVIGVVNRVRAMTWDEILGWGRALIRGRAPAAAAPAAMPSATNPERTE